MLCKNLQFKMVYKLVLIILLALQALENSAAYVSYTSKTELHHITFLNRSVYLGATNFIYKLDFSLKQLASAVTGPKLDNPQCIKMSQCSLKGIMTDNVNKILAVYEEGNYLIACGTLFQGYCKTIDLNTLQTIKEVETRFVAAHYPSASTVAFISKAPDASGGQQNVLFVGATNYKRLDYLQTKLAAVASLSLQENSLFKVIDFSGPDLLFRIDDRSYLVDYIYGFADQRYSFLATVQPDALGKNTYHSRLIRVCKKDTRYSSYTEMPISCSDQDGKNTYNILISAITANVTGKAAAILKATSGDRVFIGLFTQSKTGKSANGKYAICAYSFKDINNGFKDVIDKCLSSGSSVPRGLPWSTNGRGACTKVKPDYCGKNHEYPIGGSTPLKSATSMVYSKEDLSSVNIFVHPRGLAVFLGTVNGSLLKFTASKEKGLTKYGEDIIERGKPVKKLVFYPDKSAVLVMGKNKLVKIAVADCEKRSTCSECLAGPGCGWCSLESKCSLKMQCTGADKPLRFIETSDSLCPKIALVKPPYLSALSSKQVTIVADHLPPLSGSEKYVCSFNGAKSVANVVDRNLTCDVPNSIPGVSMKEFTNKLTISIQISTTHLDLITTKAVMYNCSVHTTCVRCTQGKYGCDWCGGSLQCIDHKSGKCGAAGNVITYAGPDASVVSSQCPRVISTRKSFIPHGIDRSLEIIGKNFPVPMGSYKYSCVVSLQGKNFTSDVISHNTSGIICAKTKYTFNKDAASMKGRVHVLYGGRHLDQQLVLEVTVYRCEYDKKECSICLRSPDPWGCGWCLPKGQCVVAELCQTKWVNSSCPAPRITEFVPKAGSVQGGTVIVIKGRDLGTTFSDIYQVTVADHVCKLNESMYLPSKQVVCQTLSVPKETTGKVVVFVRTSKNHPLLQGASKEDFSFKTPQVRNFTPVVGPCSGGTELKISGNNLNIGRHVTVLVAKKPCAVIRRTPSKILCKTSVNNKCQRRRKRQVTADDSVIVAFDGHDVPSTSNQTFAYKQDPVVNRYYTNKKSQRPETYASGGQVFTVEGERFNVIQKPRMIFHVYENGMSATRSCLSLSDTVMRCVAPNVSAIITNKNKTIVGIGFIMDDVKALLHKGNVTIVKDPVFLDFAGEEKIRVLKTRDLILEGSNLDVLHKADVRVTVGGLECAVTSLDERLVCTVPDEAERNELIPKDTNPAVIVYIGDIGLKYLVGYIKFFKPTKEEIPFLLYIGPAAAGVFVLILIIIVLVVLYRRRNKKEKEYHKVYQMQMDNLESRYARECKEAFAELQTEITDLNTDLSASVVPYLDFETYAMRILFPGIELHPVMEKECNKSDAWKKGMLSLCNLIKEKEFLLCFVKTLEGQSSFSMRDRCKVASLLMVTLQDDIAYCTSVLRDLLSELIEKSVETGRTKLLLRRTESVAEKLLTNWLAYNLHGFVEERVGETLFRLFSAIGTLLDKEPVDAVTHEARNSLSEDKLLRQKVDFKTLNVKVEYEHDESIHVQLLNVDTISQAKQKALNVIYKNVPFSQRPSRDSLELGWILPTGGVKVMNDEDDSNTIEGEWKKVNTLEHYKVSDGSLLRLSPCGTNYSIVSGSPLFHDTTLPSVLFHPNNSSTPMLNHNASENGSRLWHLVKATDYPVETRDDARHSKMMAEVYLTRLLKTKGTLQNFVDDLFDSIFKVTCRGTTIPPAVKYLFDFLDKQATFMGMENSEVIHTWKNNSLPLRFWINIIKNPNFIFDVFKSSTVDSCLSVVGQLFMDSCSPDEHRLGKDSPSNKLLYAKDIPKYKQRVARFYSDMRTMPSVNDNELSQTFIEISKKYGKTFNHLNAASELLGYAVRYKVKLMDALEMAEMEGYADRLQEMMETLPDD